MTRKSAASRRSLRYPPLIALVVIALSIRPSSSAADEHADHHPGGAAAPAAGAPPAAGMAGMGGAAAPAAGAPPAAGMAGGMEAMMAGMMPPKPSGGCNGGDCGGPGAAANPIYPTLMTLPALTPERRAEVEALATQQTNEGMARLAKGSASLTVATQAGDNVAMQQAIGVMREGLDELEAGTAARRALSEGKAPRNLALNWFKHEMNLAAPVPRDEPRALLGLTPFHLFTMVLLVAFAGAMLALYFLKMRRAAALFGRLEGDAGSPPPGASPPLAGSPAPPSARSAAPETKAAQAPAAATPPAPSTPATPSAPPARGDASTPVSGPAPK